MTPSATVRRVARNPQVAAWLAWSLCGLVVICQLLALMLEFSSRAVELSPEWGTWRSRAFGYLGMSGAAVLGAVIASRRPRNPYGWLWLIFGVLMGGVRSVAAAYGLHGAVADPGSLPAAVPVAFVADLAWALGIGMLPFLFLCYPDGRLPSARWRPVAGITIAAWALTLLSAIGFDLLGQVPIANPYQLAGPVATIAAAVGEAGLAVVFAMVFVGGGSLLVRFRRASDVERAQLKWLLFAAAVFSVKFLVDLVAPALPGVANQVLNTLVFAGFYVAIGIAILRYRLYEIDRLISRTVSYGLITGVLALVYLSAVVTIGQLSRPVTGSSQFAVAGATLTVAAAFSPVRRRVQAVVDRRFNRERYDAQRAIEGFRSRLRDEVDLAQIEVDLVGAVRSTVEPAQVSVWLRPAERRSGEVR